MKKEILEGNKLIAEFTGINVTDFVWNEHLGLVECDENGDFEIDEDLRYYSPNSDWNDLMAAVEKIKKHWFDDNDEANNVCALSISAPIGEVWIAVVQFIKWYNQNNNL